MDNAVNNDTTHNNKTRNGAVSDSDTVNNDNKHSDTVSNNNRHSDNTQADNTFSQPPTAAILVIGNEILSAKVRDSNSFFLLQSLRHLGVAVRRIMVIPDELPLIASTVKTLSDACDWVFTCGGIGPTHDDMTIEGIALGFSVPAVESPELATRLKNRYGDKLTANHLRMALIPAGAELIAQPEGHFPQVRYRNVFIFPGIPELLEKRFKQIASLLGGSPFALCVLYLKADEGHIAELLSQTEARFKPVALGSYPQWTPQQREAGSYTVKITIEGTHSQQVLAATDWLVAQLTAAQVRIVDRERFLPNETNS